MQDVPCREAKFVDASDLPPLRPQYVPRANGWQLNRQARDKNNPYNLVDKREGVVKARGAKPEPQAELAKTARPEDKASAFAPSSAQASTRAPEPAEPIPSGPAFEMDESELRDLARLSVLRQQLAPAELTIEDVRGRPQLFLRYAYSPSFEQRAVRALGLDAAK